jgi:hypothetical protein
LSPGVLSRFLSYGFTELIHDDVAYDDDDDDDDDYDDDSNDDAIISPDLIIERIKG